MSTGYVAISYRSLPKTIRDAIESKVDPKEFNNLLDRPRYGFGVRKAANHFYKKMVA